MSDGEEDREEYFTIDIFDDNELADIKCLILKNQTISLPNAIALNEALIARLKTLLGRLSESLVKCQSKYEANDKILVEMQHYGMPERKAVDYYNEHILCPSQFFGAPYFKTRNGKSAPPHTEANYRRSLYTMYPMDFNRGSRTAWTMADKSLLLRSIKETLFQYCKTQDSSFKLPKNTSLGKLIEFVKDLPFKFNWGLISDKLSCRHSSAECEAMWRLNMHPDLKRGRWADYEDDALMEAVRKCNFQDWEAIAKGIAGRSTFQCFLRYQTTFLTMGDRSKEKFSKEEDTHLIQLVNEHKVGSIIPWSTIARFFTSRSKQSLYYRYVFSLRPNITREKFSVEEDCIFLAALQEYGLNFAKIATEFPNRTVVQLRSHYNTVLKRNSEVNVWTYEEDVKLIKMHDGGSTWAAIAEKLGTHNRTTCRARYFTIKNFLEKNPKKTIKDVRRRKRSARNGVTTENWATKITEIGKKIQKANSYTQGELIKFSSFIKLLDVQINEELITEFAGSFTQQELGLLNGVLSQDRNQLMEIPMHMPTLVAFENLRKNLAESTEQPVSPSKNAVKSTVETDNFKKQFKALFYLPAILASLKPDKVETKIETQYGVVTVSY